MKKKQSGIIAIFLAAVILFMAAASSASLLYSRMIPYSEAEFVNVLPLIKTAEASETNLTIRYPDADDPDSSGGESDVAPSDPDRNGGSDDRNGSSDDKNGGSADKNGGSADKNGGSADVGQSAASNAPSGSGSADNSGTAGGSANVAHPEFRMEAEAEIFKLSYDETGKITVIGVEGNEDKLIAPGTTNLYQFTLSNPGDVPLDYTMTMEAYITGTDLWLPVYARVWDYTGKYLLGSGDEMREVLELNTVDESAELGAGRYVIYNLEWEWPFEREDENGDITVNDEYDTMLGNLAVDEDLVLHIVIRTYAEYDEDPEDPDSGLIKPPKTGDSAPIFALALICGFSLLGFAAMIFAVLKSGRKNKEKQVASK